MFMTSAAASHITDFKGFSWPFKTVASLESKNERHGQGQDDHRRLDHDSGALGSLDVGVVGEPGRLAGLIRRQRVGLRGGPALADIAPSAETLRTLKTFVRSKYFYNVILILLNNLTSNKKGTTLSQSHSASIVLKREKIS